MPAQAYPLTTKVETKQLLSIPVAFDLITRLNYQTAFKGTIDTELDIKLAALALSQLTHPVTDEDIDKQMTLIQQYLDWKKSHINMEAIIIDHYAKEVALSAPCLNKLSKVPNIHIWVGYTGALTHMTNCWDGFY